ncbi:phosphate ABC transporter permease [Tepidiphilus sp. HLB4]|jgi:phosphate transport system permease protein|uniref:Phosphate transport system permease protein n=2 Tax=Hydrogenophilaceae TaxID=206349 RepID=A0A0K6ISZ0_9PROT|nr:phosphate ABC transporter membrane protein 1, PhoT family (TC 3.A.1.7.1) [Tepidiphilus thermophilus]
MSDAMTATETGGSPSSLYLDRIRTMRHVRNGKERVIEAILFVAAFCAVAVTVAIVAILLYEASTFFAHVSLVEFLTGTEWTPLFERASYGMLPLLVGTVVTSFIAFVVAGPLGFLIAMYLSEFAPPKLAEVLKPFLELLAGVPTIVYGYFALLFVTPLLQKIIPGLPGFNMLSAGLVMGLMIVPYVASVAEDAMRAVPMALREGSYAMGATRFQTAMWVVLPASFSGVMAAFVLGISRAVGETMIVAIAAGQQPNFTFDPREPAATITAYIVQVAMGDLPHGSIGYQSIFAVGLVLVVITLVFNLIGQMLRRRIREVY